MFQDKMVTPAIPERIYAMCKVVEKGPITSKDLKDKMEPEYLGNGSEYYLDYKNAAEELGLITISDNLISLEVVPSVISSIDSMRFYINGELESFRNGQFYKVTRAYFDMGEGIFKQGENVSDMRGLFSTKIGSSVDAPAMRGWRFWATFLGFGYLQGMFVVPNANVFLWDVIKQSRLVTNKRYSMSDFIAALRPNCNIVIDSNPSTKILNYGVSSGLRTLHDAGYVRIEHILDQEDIWSLYPMKAHSLSGTITNITILKEAAQ